ncbi:MAG: tetratricopeptide repeat protein [Lishizhenia sp.]
MSRNTKIVYGIIFFLSLVSFTSVAQNREKKSKKSDLLAQSKDDVFALTQADFPYIERFHEAIRLKLAGNNVEAKKRLKECLKENPKDDAVLYALSQISATENMQSEALDYLLRAKDADPTNMHYVLEVAQVQFEKAEFEKSAANYQILVEKEPRNAELIYSYSQALVFSREYKEAVIALGKVQDLMGQFPEITFMKVELLQQLNRIDEVEAEFTALREAYPTDRNSLNKIVQFYQERGEQDKLIDILAADVEQNPSNISAQLMLAEHYINTKQIKKFERCFYVLIKDEQASSLAKASLLETAMYLKAVPKDTLLKEALKLDAIGSADAELQAIVAPILLQNGAILEGLSLQRKGLENNPNSYEAWRNLLSSELKYGFYNWLQEDADKALSIYPNLPEMYAFSAISALYLGNKERCKEQLEIGEELIVSDINGLTRATFFMVKGRLAYANKTFKVGNEMYQNAIKATDLNSGFVIDWSAQRALANVEINEALTGLQNIKSEEQTSLAYKLTLARVYFRLQAYEKSSLLLTDILKEVPSFANALDLQGDLYFMQNEEEKAVFSWKEAKRLNTSNKSIDKKIETRKLHEPIYY